PVPVSEISNRIHALKVCMENTGTGAVFLTHKPDIYYFSGTAQDAYLYVPVDHDPLLFVKRYLPRAVAETGIEQVIPVASITRIPGQIHSVHNRLPKSLGLGCDTDDHGLPDDQIRLGDRPDGGSSQAVKRHVFLCL
ncbi:MAG: aminopeptidase P family N-terminal domain-containing protein, partial [Desulfotignum sp.]